MFSVYDLVGSHTPGVNVISFQNGTCDNDYIDGAVAGPNGTYVFVGTTRGNWSATNAGDEDWVVFKIDAERNILWRWQVGATVVYVVEDI